MLARCSRWLAKWARTYTPWSNVYGLARSCVALGGLTTLLATHTDDLFVSTSLIGSVPACYGVARVGLYCVAGADHLEAARWVAIAVLALAAIGWRPRWTAVPHWWVSWSYMTSATMVDGGDQIATILAFFLIPIAVTDPRRWQWAAARVQQGSPAALFAARYAWIAIRLQMAVIYFHAAVGKFKSEEWRDGTALYYWLQDSAFGVPAYLAWLVTPMLRSGVVATAVTWGVLVFELSLFLGLLADRRYRAWLLATGILFHAGIALLHGLGSFTLVMWGGLIVYLRSPQEPFHWASYVVRTFETLVTRGARRARPPALRGALEKVVA